VPLQVRPLFRPAALAPHLAAFSLPERAAGGQAKLRRWAELLRSPDAERFTEQELLPEFLTDLFHDLLGYTSPADDPQSYTLSRERHVEADGKIADAVLGQFGGGTERPVVAVEGKGPRDPLERPFGGRRMSAVDQA
jgi:hypothetical protein